MTTSIFDYAYSKGAADALIKLGAPRHIKILRELAKRKDWQGLHDFTAELARKGVLKTSGPGTNVGSIGTGGEAFTDLVVGAGGAKLTAQHPVVARKLIDKFGPMADKHSAGETINAARRIKNRPGGLDVGGREGFSEVYGGIRRTPGGARYTLEEFLPDIKPGHGIRTRGAETALRDNRLTADAAQARGIDLSVDDIVKGRYAKIHKSISGPARRQFEEVARNTPVQGGPRLGDLHRENVVFDHRRNPRALDYSVTPAHRIDATDRALQNLQGADRLHKQQQNRLLSKYWQATGTAVPPSAFDGFGGGITGGPKSGKFRASIYKDLSLKGGSPKTQAQTIPIDVVSDQKWPSRPGYWEELAGKPKPSPPGFFDGLRKKFTGLRARLRGNASPPPHPATQKL